jgi:hypothetical protein
MSFAGRLLMSVSSVLGNLDGAKEGSSEAKTEDFERPIFLASVMEIVYIFAIESRLSPCVKMESGESFRVQAFPSSKRPIF